MKEILVLENELDLAYYRFPIKDKREPLFKNLYPNLNISNVV